MKLKLILICFFYYCFSEFECQDSGINNILFDLPDLITQYETNGKIFQIEAFKSSENDKILEEKDSTKYNKLLWVSNGQPNLLKTLSKHNTNASFFHFNNEGFYAYIQMLGEHHKKIFVDLIKLTKNIQVLSHQIVNIPLHKFYCSLKLYSNGQMYTLNGEVSDFGSFPLRIDFKAPLDSKERDIFIKRIQTQDENLDLTFQCTVGSRGKIQKTNTFSINTNQMEQLDMNEKLFGNGNSTYVTREQVSALTSMIYSSMSINEDYEMSEYEFKESFIDDFIKQTSQFVFKQVSIDEAINSLSKISFDFDQDLRPDIIRQESSKIFNLEKYGNKSHIVVDEDALKESKEKGSSNTEGKSKGKILFGLIDADVGVNFVRNKETEWKESNKNHYEQLRELNNECKDESEWTFSGEKIVIKSLNVAKLLKSKFSRTLSFKRVRKQIYEAPFLRTFSIYTIQNQIDQSLTDKIIHDLNKIQQDAIEFKTQAAEKIKSIENSINQLKTLTDTSFNTYESLFSELNQSDESFKSQLNQLNLKTDNFKSSLIDKLNTNINSINNELKTRPKSCRLCFRETEGSSQCQGNRNSCSEWTSLSLSNPAWTSPFRDDTDGRAGGCNYQWVIQCNY